MLMILVLLLVLAGLALFLLYLALRTPLGTAGEAETRRAVEIGEKAHRPTFFTDEAQWVQVSERLRAAFDLSFDEFMARYLANAPAEKVAEQRQVEANIRELHMLAEVRKILES